MESVKNKKDMRNLTCNMYIKIEPQLGAQLEGRQMACVEIIEKGDDIIAPQAGDQFVSINIEEIGNEWSDDR